MQVDAIALGQMPAEKIDDAVDDYWPAARRPFGDHTFIAEDHRRAGTASESPKHAAVF